MSKAATDVTDLKRYVSSCSLNPSIWTQDGKWKRTERKDVKQAWVEYEAGTRCVHISNLTKLLKMLNQDKNQIEEGGGYVLPDVDDDEDGNDDNDGDDDDEDEDEDMCSPAVLFQAVHRGDVV